MKEMLRSEMTEMKEMMKKEFFTYVPTEMKNEKILDEEKEPKKILDEAKKKKILDEENENDTLSYLSHDLSYLIYLMIYLIVSIS